MALWVEKYRPTALNDVIMSPSTRKILEGVMTSNKDNLENFTNMLFTGAAGTGKTSSAKMIVKVLGLPYLYINASEENGIEVMRNRIRDFATSQTIEDKLKVVILDESDGLTAAAQAALRNITESTHKSTRYILTCNYPEKIIAPLHSRLKQIVFSKPDEKVILRRMVEILKGENIQLPKEQTTKLIELTKKFYPDIRKIINHLQSFSSTGVLDIHFDDIISVDIFEQIMSSVKNKKLSEIRSILRNNKVDYDGLVRKIFDDVLSNEPQYFKDLSEGKRAEIILLCADTLFKGNFVVDKEINFCSFLVELSRSGI